MTQFSLMNKSDRNFEYEIQKNQMENDTMNYRIMIKYIINQYLSNLK